MVEGTFMRTGTWCQICVLDMIGCLTVAYICNKSLLNYTKL